MSKKKIGFIINPISGTNGKERLHELIYSTLNQDDWDIHVVFTQYQGHGTMIAKDFVQADFHSVVAVGGDGTLHEVADGVRDTNTALGIVPQGSGNGFARHLGIPTNTKVALQIINESAVTFADYGMVNERPFFSICGAGFDALVADKFAKKNTRGFNTYIETIFKEVFKYESEKYRIVGQGIDVVFSAFIIAFSNTGQWGYEAKIAPEASVQDGKMDITVLSNFPLIFSPLLALSLFTKTIDEDMFAHVLKLSEATIIREDKGLFHIDGDPLVMPKELHIKMIENGIRLLVKRRY